MFINTYSNCRIRIYHVICQLESFQIGSIQGSVKENKGPKSIVLQNLPKDISDIVSVASYPIASESQLASFMTSFQCSKTILGVGGMVQRCFNSIFLLNIKGDL